MGDSLWEVEHNKSLGTTDQQSQGSSHNHGRVAFTSPLITEYSQAIAMAQFPISKPMWPSAEHKQPNDSSHFDA